MKNLQKLHPDLLACKFSFTDHAGRIIFDRTIYQVFLAYADKDAYLMLEEDFLRLPDGDNIMKQQFFEQFPDGVIKMYPKYNLEKAFEIFKQAVAKIQTDPLISYDNGDNYLNVMSPDTKKLIDQFHAITSQKNLVYTIGLINDMKLYNKTVDFCENENEFKKFKSNAHRDVCWIFLLGRQQRDFTPNMGAALCQGFYYLTKQGNPEQLKRNFKSRYNNELMFPIDDDSQSKFRLGFHFFIDDCGFAWLRCRLTCGAWARAGELCRANATSLDNLMQRFQLAEERVETKECVEEGITSCCIIL